MAANVQCIRKEPLNISTANILPSLLGYSLPGSVKLLVLRPLTGTCREARNWLGRLPQP